MPGRGDDAIIMRFGSPLSGQYCSHAQMFIWRRLTPRAERLRVLDIGSVGGGRFHAQIAMASIGVHHEHFLHYRRDRRTGEQRFGGESVSQSLLKDQAFSTFLAQTYRLSYGRKMGFRPSVVPGSRAVMGGSRIITGRGQASQHSPRRPCSSDPLFTPAAEELELNPAQVRLSGT
jgi:hypothetical protein